VSANPVTSPSPNPAISPSGSAALTTGPKPEQTSNRKELNMTHKPQEFYVTLRIVTDPTVTPNKKITEERIRKILKKALNPAMDEIIETIRFGDVIDVTK
jgi:hypothetical protein